MRRITAFALLLSCSRAPTPLHAEPSHASSFGDVDVTITGDFSSIGAIREVTIGGVRGLDLRVSDHAVTVRIQGSPTVGPARIRVSGDGDYVFDDGAFSFDPPSVLPRWVAFGASLTEGMQSSGLDARGQLHGYAAQIARAAGVFLAPPLASDCLFPPMRASQFVSDCSTTYDPGAIVSGMIACVTDPATHDVDLTRGRIDATLQTRDLAVGGSKLRDVIFGMAGPAHAIEKIGELPDGDTDSLWTPITKPQLERIRELDADVGLSGDLLANDLIPAVTQSDDIHVELATPVTDVAAQLDTILSALGALHGDYFIANLLDITALPAVATLRARRIAAGQDTDSTFDAKVDAVRAVEHAYNDALAKSAARFPNVHVVDFATEGAKVLVDGVTIRTTHLTAQRFGGLLSLDHLHFSDTGYAVMANVFIRALDDSLGVHIPEVDLEAVLEADPFSPDNLAKQGVHCTNAN